MTAAALFEGPAPRVFSIDAGRPFLIDLAKALFDAAGGDPIALSDMRVFVPTRRAVRALTDAFLTAARERACLPPRIVALGDIEEDALLLDDAMFAAPEAADLPPPVSPVERRLVLARFVAAADAAFAGQESWPGAVAAACALESVLDAFYAEEASFDALRELAPEAHAAHWEKSLDFLKVAVVQWPDYLRRRGLSDPAERRVRLLDLQRRAFEAAPPASPVLVAGTTGAAPAVARLAATVARLPKGAVVLPGLDRALAADARAWDAIDDPHPQAGLKALLDRLGAAPGAVRPFPGGENEKARRMLVSLALRPAGATDDWRDLVKSAAASDPGLARACEGLSLVEAADEDAEASAVAILMREAVETPGRTAMLVTPDRGLGRRVAAKLRRWDIVVDDSGGAPFAHTPCGYFLRAVADWLAAPGDAVRALSVLRAPLCGLGLDAAGRASALRALDLGLRGTAHEGGVDALARKLGEDPRRAEKAGPALAALQAAAALQPAGARAPFEARLQAHLAAAELLAGDDREPGETRLWRGEDGETGARLFQDLGESAHALGALGAADYADAIAQIMAGPAVRGGEGRHPRLSILGPLEARLQAADLVILGGLNEGVWPQQAATDPFLSRPMREKAGLPSPERRLGLSAHDFAQLAQAPRVALTRARMAAGAPAKPSRWIVRLKNVLSGANAEAAVDDTARLAAWTDALDRPDEIRPATAPAPRPPLALRPRKLHVTRLEWLMRDPYSIYARYILRLRKLDSPGLSASNREIGLLLHAAFEAFVRGGGDPDREDAREILLAHIESGAARMGLGAAFRARWRPRLAAAADWHLDWDRAQRRAGAPALVEAEGEWAFAAPAGPFTLAARADRIDMQDGEATIFDFKTSAPPSLKQIQADFNPQLPLTALIVEEGGFDKLGKAKVRGFHYVRSTGQTGKKDVIGAEGDEARALMREAREGMTALVAHFDDPHTAYISQPRPQFANRYGDYDHLARRREWASRDGDE